ncbi:unnamed protein product [Clavelina lepadiformis]|uniref:VWFA domain-containing protein n=1 Tax=Clavelina lepadiformis TaxID=159417 RepID=A0ABP0FZ37_CLALP
MCGTTVTRTAEWSKALDDQFKTNMANDPSLKWQYFASPTGILRIYPGLQWDMLHCNNRPNMYDCRKKQWYIQAATYPKNVLILLDTSGSMIGTNLFVAEYAVPEIFKFLGDNDFFNVLTFGKDAKPINKCYGFELMPANWKNKRTVLEDISKIKPYGYADYNVTLHTVLDLLKKFRSQQGGSYCDFMLLIITDGAPENFDQIFGKYYKDNDFQIRIFPYLVGYDKSSLSSLRQMACHNNGYFTHLMNRASVRYRVLEQVHILNRPLAFHQDYHVAWTKAYYTGKLEKESSHLVCTISMAAHRKINGTATLLGVLATDIPLDDILDSIPINNIGVNGYIYMITNNGHTLIHPRFNPRYNEFGLEGLRPNYEGIDIDDLENSLAGRQVRAELINKTGSLAADRIVTPLFGMNRVLILSGTYYYAPIRETPYYLAAVLPSGYGHTSLKYPDVLQRRSHDAKYDAKSCGEALKRWMISATSISRTAAICSLLYSGIGVAESWRYCQHIQDNVGPHEMSQLDMLKAFVTDKHNDTISCDEELVTGVLYDAYHMAVIQPFWSEFRQFRKTTREGVIMTFVISKNGVLMEYWHEEAQGFHSKARNTIFKFSRVEFPDVYRRTVEQPPDDWLYSLPNNKSSMERDSIVIAATKAFRLNNAVLGVAGLLFKHSRFSENFNNFEDMSENCGKRYKRFFDCYLIDENAITLYADDESQVGQYLGLINGPVMSSLLKDKIFNVVELMDYNAVCKTHPPQTNSPASYRQSVSRLPAFVADNKLN